MLQAGPGPFNYPTLIAIEFATVGFFEYFRYKAYKEKGTMVRIINYGFCALLRRHIEKRKLKGI